jgi:hypothetical protein
VKHKTIVKSFKKCGVSNSTDGTECSVLFEENEIFTVIFVMSKCCSIDDFMEFYDQQKLCTVLSFY